MATVLIQGSGRRRKRRCLTLCSDCGRLAIENEATCHRCDSTALNQVSSVGGVYSYTTVHAGSDSFVLALVELADGEKVTARIVDADQELRIGLPVQMEMGLSFDSDAGAVFFSPLGPTRSPQSEQFVF